MQGVVWLRVVSMVGCWIGVMGARGCMVEGCMYGGVVGARGCIVEGCMYGGVVGERDCMVEGCMYGGVVCGSHAHD